MTRFARVLPALVCMASVAFLAVLDARGGEGEAAAKKTFEQLIAAVKKADRDAFVANATDAVKKGVDQDVMDSLKKDLGSRVEKGHKATFLCQLKQAGHVVHLWKVEFKDDGDDVIVRVALKDGKVAGFFLQ